MIIRADNGSTNDGKYKIKRDFIPTIPQKYTIFGLSSYMSLRND